MTTDLQHRGLFSDPLTLATQNRSKVVRNETTDLKQTTITAVSPVSPTIRNWLQGFFVAKRSKRIAPTTIRFYQERLDHFTNYCERRNITTLEVLDATLIREYLLHLEESGHNPGGVHSFYRIIKVFLRWYEKEVESPDFRNPIKKVDAPKVPEEILDPVDAGDVSRMLETCGPDRLGLRDRAILKTLLDTGARASELTALDISDLDRYTGEIVIRHGKGDKWRKVFAGERTRKVLRAYLKVRGERPGPLFLARGGERLDYFGLRAIIKRRASDAGIDPAPPLHSFRRACALSLVTDGVDLMTVKDLLGHADLSVLKRYVKLNTAALRAAHAAHSPVDRAGL